MNDLLLAEYHRFKNEKKLERFNISDRESEIIFLITKGLGNKNIGDLLYISENTVKKHIYNIFNKLRISSRMKLFIFIEALNEEKIEKAC